MMTDEYKSSVRAMDRILSVLSDKTGKGIRIIVALELIRVKGDSYPIWDLSRFLGISRQQLSPHLRRLYDADLITNPTRNSSVEATKRLMDVSEGLTLIFERI